MFLFLRPLPHALFRWENIITDSGTFSFYVFFQSPIARIFDPFKTLPMVGFLLRGTINNNFQVTIKCLALDNYIIYLKVTMQIEHSGHAFRR